MKVSIRGCKTAEKVLQLGRNKTYEFLKVDYPVPVIHVGHQIRVPAKQFFE